MGELNKKTTAISQKAIRSFCNIMNQETNPLHFFNFLDEFSIYNHALVDSTNQLTDIKTDNNYFLFRFPYPKYQQTEGV